MALTEIMSRRPNEPPKSGRMFAWRSSDGVQLPEQLLRPAMSPSWRLRQSRASRGPFSSSRRKPFATAVSPLSAATVGLKMNARSLRAPSPLTSLPTRGVNGAPDTTRMTDVTSSHDFTSHVVVPTNECRRSKSLRAHGKSLGLPAVVGEPNPPPAEPPPPPPPPLKKDDWSDDRMSVYDRFQIKSFLVTPFTDSVSCAVRDRKPDVTSSTCAN